MRNILLALVCVISASWAQTPVTGKELLTKMHEKYAGKWYKTFQFKQTTDMYKNDSLIRSQVWIEHIQFPQNFRIDFGNADSGNAVIFKNDSSYYFKNSQLLRTDYYPNDLLFLLGGMYFYPLNEAIAKMKTYGFDINKFHESKWNGNDVYVIGSNKDGEETNQAWFDKEHYSLVRMIKYENGRKEDALLEDHVKLDGGYSETQVKFYMNDKLLQVEKYFDLEANKKINPEIFNTQNFIKAIQQ
jgi:hypothetical protein